MMEENVYIQDFAARLTQLRQQRNCSARDMSLSLGQGHSFIHSIESGKNFSTMLNFFYICEFLGVSAETFFQYNAPNPGVLADLLDDLKALDSEQLESMAKIAKGLRKSCNP